MAAHRLLEDIPLLEAAEYILGQKRARLGVKL